MGGGSFWPTGRIYRSLATSPLHATMIGWGRIGRIVLGMPGADVTVVDKCEDSR